jgi:hypothetical protein
LAETSDLHSIRFVVAMVNDLENCYKAGSKRNPLTRSFEMVALNLILAGKTES